MNDILSQLQQNFGHDKVKDAGRRAKLICPYHANGMEKTPSLVVNLTEPYLGRFYCFACGEKGSLEELLGREESEDQFYSMGLDDLPELDEIKVDNSWKKLPRWDKNKEWRTIPGWLVRRVKGRLETTKFGERLLLPCMQHGENVGSIHCTFFKTKMAYVYDKHPFIRSTLFPYDYTKKVLHATKAKTLFIVEGPRDALKLLSYGIPAVANLGGNTVWSSDKVSLIETLNPRRIISAPDPDTVGDKLNDLIMAEFSGIPKRRLLFDVKYDNRGKITHKEDPGNMSEIRLLKLAREYS